MSPKDVTAESIMDAAKSAKAPDVSGISLLQYIFGPIVFDPLNPKSASGTYTSGSPLVDKGGSTNPMFSAIFGVLNLSLLALGLIYLSYSIVAGVAQTAQDGEFIGKRFSTLWVPIRLITGTIGLIPAFGGWSIAQLVIVWASVMGVGIGNMATYKIADLMGNGTAVLSHAQPQAGRELVMDVFKMNLCMASTNKNAPGSGWKKYYIGKTANYGPNAVCGSVDLPGSFANTNKSSTAVRSAFDSMDSELAAEAVSLIDSVHIDGEGNSAEKVSYKSERIFQIANNFSERVIRATQGQSVELKQERVKTNLEQQGFAGLGAYFTSLSSAGMTASGYSGLLPTVEKVAPSSEDLSASLRPDYEKSLIIVAQKNSEDRNIAKPAAGSDGNYLVRALVTLGDANSDACSATTIFSKGFGPYLKEISGSDNKCGANDSMLLKTSNLGGDMAMVSGAGLLVVKGLQGAYNGAVDKNFFLKAAEGTVPAVGAVAGAQRNVINYIAENVIVLLQIMVFFGAMLAYYMPLLPYIAWLGAMISWLSIVIEGVIAAPLWAFAHLDTDGEGMGQKTQHGYIFLLQVLLRPILMVVGFVAAVMVMDVMGKFFYATFPLALSDAGTVGSWIDLIGVVVAIAVFFTTSVMIVNLSTNLIHFIPNVALQWMGAGTESGKSGAGANGEFTQASAGAIAAGKQLAGGAAQMGMHRKKARYADMESDGDDDGFNGAENTSLSGAMNSERKKRKKAR